MEKNKYTTVRSGENLGAGEGSGLNWLPWLMVGAASIFAFIACNHTNEPPTDNGMYDEGNNNIPDDSGESIPFPPNIKPNEAGVARQTEGPKQSDDHNAWPQSPREPRGKGEHDAYRLEFEVENKNLYDAMDKLDDMIAAKTADLDTLESVLIASGARVGSHRRYQQAATELEKHKSASAKARGQMKEIFLNDYLPNRILDNPALDRDSKKLLQGISREVNGLIEDAPNSIEENKESSLKGEPLPAPPGFAAPGPFSQGRNACALIIKRTGVDPRVLDGLEMLNGIPHPETLRAQFEAAIALSHKGNYVSAKEQGDIALSNLYSLLGGKTKPEKNRIRQTAENPVEKAPPNSGGSSVLIPKLAVASPTAPLAQTEWFLRQP